MKELKDWRGSSGVGPPRAQGSPRADDHLIFFWVLVSSFHTLRMDIDVLYFLGDDLHHFSALRSECTIQGIKEFSYKQR